MRYLLDTHTFAWAIGDPSQLGAVAADLLRDVGNELLVSPVSVWELSIKHHLGKWPAVAPFMDERLYESFTDRLGTKELVVQTSHARLAGQFHVAHADPFDRLLASQSLLEGATLISKDAAFDLFPIDRVW